MPFWFATTIRLVCLLINKYIHLNLRSYQTVKKNRLGLKSNRLHATKQQCAWWEDNPQTVLIVFKLFQIQVGTKNWLLANRLLLWLERFKVTAQNPDCKLLFLTQVGTNLIVTPWKVLSINRNPIPAERSYRVAF